MRPKSHALFTDLAEIAQAENLKAAAIGQYPAVPVHKPVQTAGFANNLVSRAQKQMVGVAENKPGAHRIQFLRRQCFHGSLRAHRHKHRGVERTVGSMETPDARSRFRTFLYQFISNRWHGLLLP